MLKMTLVQLTLRYANFFFVVKEKELGHALFPGQVFKSMTFQYNR